MGLPLVAPEADVKRHYRKLAAQVHPDKCKLEGAEEAFKLLGRAVAHALSAADKNRYTIWCIYVLLQQYHWSKPKYAHAVRLGVVSTQMCIAQHAVAQAMLRDTGCCTSLATCS